MANNANAVISQIMQLKSQGKSPQAVMQILFGNNPNLQMYKTQLQNMSKGKSPQEFLTQIARQNGVTAENINAMKGMFGGK